MSPTGNAPPLDPLSALVDAWCDADRTHAVLPADHAVILATRSLRSLVLGSLEEGPATDDRDLLNAFGALGRLVAEGGGSPTLAASIVDGLLHALAGHPLRPRLETGEYTVAARAAVVESYLHVRLATCQTDALRAWDYPACAVSLGDGRVAVAGGYPDRDDALEEWASRVVHGVALGGARQLVVAGEPPVVEALERACGLVGIDLTTRPPLPVSKSRAPKAR